MWYLTREVHHAKKMFSVYSNLDKKKKKSPSFKLS